MSSGLRSHSFCLYPAPVTCRSGHSFRIFRCHPEPLIFNHIVHSRNDFVSYQCPPFCSPTFPVLSLCTSPCRCVLSILKSNPGSHVHNFATVCHLDVKPVYSFRSLQTNLVCCCCSHQPLSMLKDIARTFPVTFFSLSTNSLRTATKCL